MSTVERWEKDSTDFLKGKTVKRVRYMTTEEVADMGWQAAAPVIEFTDGSWILASRDDEGNDAGALFTSDKTLDTIPVIANYLR
jgi:hypothetical protein